MLDAVDVVDLVQQRMPLALRLLASAYVRIRQHTSAYLEQRMPLALGLLAHEDAQARVSIRQHTSAAYVSMYFAKHLLAREDAEG